MPDQSKTLGARSKVLLDLLRLTQVKQDPGNGGNDEVLDQIEHKIRENLSKLDDVGISREVEKAKSHHLLSEYVALMLNGNNIEWNFGESCDDYPGTGFEDLVGFLTWLESTNQPRLAPPKADTKQPCGLRSVPKTPATTHTEPGTVPQEVTNMSSTSVAAAAATDADAHQGISGQGAAATVDSSTGTNTHHAPAVETPKTKPDELQDTCGGQQATATANTTAQAEQAAATTNANNNTPAEQAAATATSGEHMPKESEELQTRAKAQTEVMTPATTSDTPKDGSSTHTDQKTTAAAATKENAQPSQHLSLEVKSHTKPSAAAITPEETPATAAASAAASSNAQQGVSSQCQHAANTANNSTQAHQTTTAAAAATHTSEMSTAESQPEPSVVTPAIAANELQGTVGQQATAAANINTYTEQAATAAATSSKEEMRMPQQQESEQLPTREEAQTEALTTSTTP